MKVLLLKDVYKLGHAGDVKKVADGYGRNYLIPRGLAALATAGALTKSETLRAAAAKRREALNTELGGLAEKLNGLSLRFPAKAGETGKLYGSITTQMIAEAIEKESGEKVDRRNVGHQPLRELGTFKVPVRLTADLVPNVTVIIHREGQAPEAPAAPAPAPVVEAALEAEPPAPAEEEAPTAE
ncbi:MAG: 50S ribosomal protein L9 [Chloroflexi bacterium]|nr:50S ribosomal protein L9 [Chloroflexota bacterium]